VELVVVDLVLIPLMELLLIIILEAVVVVVDSLPVLEALAVRVSSF